MKNKNTKTDKKAKEKIEKEICKECNEEPCVCDEEKSDCGCCCCGK